MAKPSLSILFRFKLRFLFAMVTLAACWIGWEAKQAEDQERFARAIDAVGGEYVAYPRTWVPSFLQERLSPSWAQRIQKVVLVGALAPQVSDDVVHPLFVTGGERIKNSNELLNVLGMPAAHHLRDVELAGTAVDRRFLQTLAELPRLETYFIIGSAIPKSDLEDYAKRHPGFRNGVGRLNSLSTLWLHGVLVSQRGGPDIPLVELLHGKSITEVPDKTVFAKAISGDTNAIAAVIELIWQYDESSLPLTKTLSLICERDATLLYEALYHEKQSVRRAIYSVLDRHGDHALLAEIGLEDKSLQDLAVGTVLRFRLWQFGDRIAELAMDGEHRVLAAQTLFEVPPQDRYIPALLSVLDGAPKDLRWELARALRYYNSDARVVAAMADLATDEESIVRARTMKSLATSTVPAAIQVVRSALDDEDSIVRKHAQESFATLSTAGESLETQPESQSASAVSLP